MSTRALFLALLATLAPASELPLPEAPLRLVIPDAQAFDAALTGDFRRFLSGDPRNDDRLTAAWRRSRVGSKLEDQWRRLATDLPWTWLDLQKLKPTAVGLALLQVGHLEAVLVVDTPLAQLPMTLPKGTAHTLGGVAYQLVTRGGGEGGDKDRRMGLAHARIGTRLILATSERAMRLAIGEALAGRGLAPPLPGLASMDLDLDALRKDRYFRREFPFPWGPESGHVRVALRREGNGLSELRRGSSDARPGVFSFPASAGSAQGWEPDGTGFWSAFRRGLLEPVPEPAEQPVIALAPLPGPENDRYLQDLTRPSRPSGAVEEGELGSWKALLTRTPVTSWGYWVTADGGRRIAFPWPEDRDDAFLQLCQATLARRAGRVTLVKVGPTREFQVGPGLPTLALRRTGPVLWAGASAHELEQVPTPQLDPGLIRWARIDLDTVRAEQPRWRAAEGPAQPERVRPLSDQVLGLLGWVPGIRTLAVERRRTADGWEERVSFGARTP